MPSTFQQEFKTLEYNQCFNPMNFFIDPQQCIFTGKGKSIFREACSYEVTVPLNSFEEKTIVFENYSNIAFSVSTYLEEEKEEGQPLRIEYSFDNCPSRYRIEFINKDYEQCTICWADQQEFIDDITPLPHPSRQIYNLCSGKLEEESQLHNGKFADVDCSIFNMIQYEDNGQISGLYHVRYGLYYGQQNAHNQQRLDIPVHQLEKITQCRGFGTYHLFPSIDSVLRKLRYTKVLENDNGLSIRI